jgi:hypothetical protein
MTQHLSAIAHPDSYDKMIAVPALGTPCRAAKLLQGSGRPHYRKEAINKRTPRDYFPLRQP